MTRGLFNWTFRDVVAFLRSHRFVHTHTEGSHFFYVGHYGGQSRLVQVPFHPGRILKPRTVKSIIRQSGIPEKLWRES